jgi:hypothetical protein
MLSSSQFASDAVDLDDLRARLGKMTDAGVIAFGKAARYMCSPAANLGKPPRQPFVIRLREARGVATTEGHTFQGRFGRA